MNPKVIFAVLGHPVLDAQYDGTIDHILKYLKEHPVGWIAPPDELSAIEQWCKALSPRRLLLYHSDSSLIVRGFLHLLSPKTIPSQNWVLFSRGTLIPEHTLFHTAVHCVDDDREQNRECYRIYKRRGYRIETA